MATDWKMDLSEMEKRPLLISSTTQTSTSPSKAAAWTIPTTNTGASSSTNSRRSIFTAEFTADGCLRVLGQGALLLLLSFAAAMLVIAGVSGAINVSCKVSPGLQGTALCSSCQHTVTEVSCSTLTVHISRAVHNAFPIKEKQWFYAKSMF